MTSASQQFAAPQLALARWARALGHPARVQILDVLARRRTCMCGDIVGELPLAQSTVSQHLRELRDAGLITGDIDGPRVCYCIDREGLQRCRAAFAHLFGQLEADAPSDDCC